MTTMAETTRRHYVPTADDLNDAIVVLLNENESPLQPSAKEVQTILEKQNSTWKLPERRVAKFLKKQKKIQKAKENKESHLPADDEVSASSAASRTRHLLHSTGAALKSTKKSVKNILTPFNKENESSGGSSKKSFSFRKKKKHHETETPAEKSDAQSAPPPEKKMSLLPELDSEESEEDEVEPVSVESPEPEDVQTDEVNNEKVKAEEENVEEAKPEVADRDAALYEDDNTGKVEKSDLCSCSGCVIL